MTLKTKIHIKRLALCLCTFLILAVAFTVYANLKVEKVAASRLYTSVDSIPYNKVGLLLGTNPLNKWGQPNSYFTNRINTAAELLGEKIKIPDITSQRSYSTAPGMTMKIVEPDLIVSPVDSLVVEFTNSRSDEGTTGEYFKIERFGDDGNWHKLPLDRKYVNKDGEICIIFNDVGYLVFPEKPMRMTVKPWFYEKTWQPGKYRLAKTYHFPPYPIEKSDTAYVEFEIK